MLLVDIAVCQNLNIEVSFSKYLHDIVQKPTEPKPAQLFRPKFVQAILAQLPIIFKVTRSNVEASSWTYYHGTVRDSTSSYVLPVDLHPYSEDRHKHGFVHSGGPFRSFYTRDKRETTRCCHSNLVG